MEKYTAECKASSDDREQFWANKAKKYLSWDRLFTKTHNGEFEKGEWFCDGMLNASYNCVDRWANECPDRVAIIYDDNGQRTEKYTYKEVLGMVNGVAGALKWLNVGDCVTVYMPMSPMALFIALGCARLGLIHNFVFGGFSATSLRTRIVDSNSKLVISQGIAKRGEKEMNLLAIADEAVAGLEIACVCYDGEFTTAPPPRRMRWASLYPRWAPWAIMDTSHVQPVSVPSEHPLFYLYTSGSTGLPKGIIHGTGRYLAYVAYTLETVFGTMPGDVFCCTADIGWITGHSYSLYAPLLLGITTVILSGPPMYPSPARLFEIVEKYSITHLYTAPTVVRLLRAHYGDLTPPFSSSGSLRCLGSVGEPLDAETQKWFTRSFGGAPVIDTYFQTETGGILIAPLLGLGPVVPGCTGYPVPGIEPRILTSQHVNQLFNINKPNMEPSLGRLYITAPWPGLCKGILNSNGRFASYFADNAYFTGDGGTTKGGLYWVLGRADDEINVAGHRISTAEVESAACSDANVAEAAVVCKPHPIKGQCMVLFVALKHPDADHTEKIRKTVSDRMGGFCKPDLVVACASIPKTATGKIIRRLLRAIVAGEAELGDLSTCINKEEIPGLLKAYEAIISKHQS